jgi:alanine transaminase
MLAALRAYSCTVYLFVLAAFLMCVGLSGPPPGEIVEGLRNPYLDKFVPPRRREPSESYKNYKPLRPEYVHLPFAAAEDPVDALQKGVEDLEGRVNTGAGA